MPRKRLSRECALPAFAAHARNFLMAPARVKTRTASLCGPLAVSKETYCSVKRDLLYISGKSEDEDSEPVRLLFGAPFLVSEGPGKILKSQ